MSVQQNPVVSIIVPCKNYGRFLPALFASLHNQKFELWECLIINNGSTDDTREIVTSTSTIDGRFVLIDTDAKGVSAARNVGLRMAKGTLIQFLDADDLLQSNKISSQVNYLLAHPEVDLVYGDARYFLNENPEELFLSRDGRDQEWIPKLSGSGDTVVRQLLRGNFAPIQSPLFKKVLIDKCGAFDESLTGFEDWDLFLRFALNDVHFKYHQDVDDWSLVRLHQASASHDDAMMFSHFLPIYQNTSCDRKISLGNRLVAVLRFIEEFWNLIFLSNRRKRIFKRSHQYSMAIFALLVLISIFCLPLYIVIKFLRMAKSK